MFRRLLDLARSRRLALTLTILLGWLGGLAAILQAWYLSGTIDSVFLENQTLADVTPLLAALGVVILVRAAAVGGSESAANAVALRVKADLRARLLAHLARLGPSFTQGEKTGELSTSAIEGVEALDAWFSQYLPQAALAAFIPLSVLLLVFPLDPLTGVVFALTAPLIPLFMYLIGKTAEALTKRQWETLSHLSAYFLDVLQGLTTLKLLGQSRRQAGRIAEASDRFRDVTLSVLRVTFLSALALELLSTVGTAIVAVEIGLRLLYGHMAFREAMFILVLAPDFYLPMRLLGLRFHAGMSGVSAARRIFEILDTPLPRSQVDTFSRLHVPTSQPVNVPTCEPANLPTCEPANLSTCNITFSNVSYSYRTRDLPALDDVSFDLPHGQMTALVGASGAGKSTVASLLLRFIEPEAGEIRVDGAPLSGISPADWRRRLAWVPQNPYLFNDTLAANLRLAKPDASIGDMLHACRRAGLDDFIAALPDGLETVVGERGARLSGGQAQRLALARAFLRDAPFLILDEPTSSLDPALESRLHAAVRDLMAGRTTLVIAHRLATIAKANQIIVLDSGRVAETGTHTSLLKQNGLYATLVASAGH
ncbi:MAG: ATP-binding cassette subfamily C bacterial CydD [Anaerolineaceae bacterium]|nr:MAG: ATP-binding cassette subfamily C bacterial CydD [Anaerolineaceae bacterium]